MPVRTLKRVLITGGAGFIGSNLTHLVQKETGADVVVLDDLSSGDRENLERQHVTFVEGDVRDAGTVRSAIEGCDTVFHLAASVGNRRSIDHPVADSQINVLGTLNVLEAARHAGIDKVIYSSSAAIFGELKTLPIREDHPLEPDTPYGASKLGGEKLCLAYAKLYPIDCVALRYFNVYGPHQRYDAYGNVIPIFAHRALRGEPITIFGDGEQTRDFVNVRDVAAANLAAARAPGVSGAFNVASGVRVTINRLADLVAATSGRAVEIVHVDPRNGDVRHSLADISAARVAFGYEASVTLDVGLSGYMTWCRRALVTGGRDRLAAAASSPVRRRDELRGTSLAGHRSS
ncbi:MAG TPA: NAD-dependent epimerase/dehydratase family protein [Vicinamibacterales bacterium]|nr:NAD-dependent epimerase/dehydratase family protein [Vicinamibacterales bacterium]